MTPHTALPMTHRNRLGSPLAFAYGVAVYVAFLIVLVYAIAFVENAHLQLGPVKLSPFTISGPATAPATIALVVNVLLLGLFALQHSVMARGWFKRWLTRWLPAPVERTTYVLAATACLAALLVLWQPIGGTVWQVGSGALRTALIGLSLAGWALVVLSTFLIDHFDLFGLRQTFAALCNRDLTPLQFRTPLLYGLVRHPIYLGFLIAFWATPVMTTGHLLFAVATTGYIFVGIRFEERDLVRAFGEQYRSYRRRVPMIVPGARVRR